MIKVSIITPSFNQAKFIEETLVSVFNQTYQPIEYIVIDGGSTDGSQEIIKKYSDHINYWVSEKDNGQSDAINKGLLRSTGEIVCWLNSDDILLPDAIEKAIKFFEAEPSVDFIHGKSILFGDGKREKIIGDKINDLSLRYVSYIPFPQPSSFFRRKIIEETGLLKTDLHYGMDFELLARVALKYKILHVSEIFSKYRLHDQAKTVDSKAFCRDWSIVFSKVLRSLDRTGEFIESYKVLDFYFEGDDKFEVLNFEYYDHLKKSFLYNLFILFHYYYNAGLKKEVIKIGDMIKHTSYDFFKENKLETEIRKIKYINPSLISILRKVKKSIIKN